MRRILNAGCGRSPMKSNGEIQVINVDAIIKDTIIMNFDITKTPYPFEAENFDIIYFFHTIEHIPEERQAGILCEFRRILKSDGKIFLAYPEFKKIAKRYIDAENDEDRQFFKATIYGRGLTEWDRHKALMDTGEFKLFVPSCGLRVVDSYSEARYDYNTITVLKKGDYTLTYEKLMEEEFGLSGKSEA